MSSPQQAAILVETSGTEGQPKRIALSYQRFRESARLGQQLEDLRSGDCWLNCLPLRHVGGLAIQFRCELAGATMLLHADFDPEKIATEIDQYGVTHLSLVPVMLSRLLDYFGEARAPQGLRTVLMGGDRLSKSIAERAVKMGWPIAVSYGMTETVSRITLLRLNEENIGAWEESDVGAPLPGVTLSIGDDGVISVESKALLPEGVLVTKDIGSIDSRGHLHLHGRQDDQFLSAGLLIDPLQVEQQLQQCPDIGPVGVAGKTDPTWGAVVTAVVEAPVTEKMKQWIAQQLPSSIRPRQFIEVERLQRGATGKLNRNWLRAVVNDVA